MTTSSKKSKANSYLNFLHEGPNWWTEQCGLIPQPTILAPKRQQCKLIWLLHNQEPEPKAPTLTWQAPSLNPKCLSLSLLHRTTSSHSVTAFRACSRTTPETSTWLFRWLVTEATEEGTVPKTCSERVSVTLRSRANLSSGSSASERARSEWQKQIGYLLINSWLL